MSYVLGYILYLLWIVSLLDVASDPGAYFTIDQITGRLFNAKIISVQDSNWTAQGYITLKVKVSNNSGEDVGMKEDIALNVFL